jgi:hypothetical protein
MSGHSIPKVEVFSVGTIDELADCLPYRHRYFTLLLAWDVPNIEQETLRDVFRPLVSRGLAYLCAWGGRCETVHDVVDFCVVEKELQSGEGEHLLVTTWHADEALKEATWFFKMSAIPSENHVFADFDRFAVSVGNPDRAQEMDRYLSERAVPDSEIQ